MKRLLFGSILAALLAVVLTACGGTETETIVVKEEVIREVPVEVVVEKEVIKEVMVPGETVVVKEEVVKEVMVPGETVVVTKEVPVEVVREVVKQVEVVREVEIPAETFVMTKKRHPLIGDLEGPTVLPGFVPAKYSEAPMLAEMVAAGKLPPVEERVGPEPLVMRPTHEVGKYGGTWHRGFIGPNDGANAVRAIWHDRLLYWNTEGDRDSPQHGPLLHTLRRRQDQRLHAAPRAQVVRRGPVHRGRLHVLVRAPVQQQGRDSGPAPADAG